MPDLLLELFSEEIPARMQAQAAKDLERLVVGALSDRGLMFEGVKSFAGPRRLTLAIAGLPAKQPDVSEEKKGPRVGANEKAIQGFLRSAGVTLDQCEKRDDGKGEFYVAVISRKGRATAEVLAEFLPEAVAKLPWPKSMRFPAGGTQRWVRPLHSILCTFDGEVVPFEFAGIKSGNKTQGHRFLSKGAIEARHFEDYEKKLRDAYVIVDAAERMEIIAHEAKQKAFALGLELIEDAGLLEEVAGLAEWPVVLIGTIEDQFMDVPPEILQTSMRMHQKYFALNDPKTGKLANRFALVSNMVASDGGKEIVAGNERVLRARLSDAKFFWDQDRKRSLESRVDDLKQIVFHAKAGDILQRTKRISALAQRIAELLKFPREISLLAMRAGLLAKADLLTGVVGEFPELQGIMGKYYALPNEPPEVAVAIADQYMPRGEADVVPDGPVSISLAIAEKIDSLVELWYAGEKPTGSKDPLALRRSALGVIRILLERNLRLPLTKVIRGADFNFAEDIGGVVGPPPTAELLAFFADRLKVILRKEGTRHDLIDAVFSLGNEDDLVRLVARVEALQTFLKSDDGANLLAGYKRAANILRIERKKDGDKDAFSGTPDPKLLQQAEEKNLFTAMATANDLIKAELERERFVEAMTAMARMRAPVDAFFEHVTVNDKDSKLRENRLKLLAQIVATAHTVADFSKIEG